LKPKNLLLPIRLRSELSKPFGRLIKGTIEETIPLLRNALSLITQLVVGVGDVTAELLVRHDLKPDIIITDGYTKRKRLTEWKSYPHFIEIHAECPAAQITVEAWEAIQMAVVSVNQGKQVHLKIIGEEDLLVLPLLMELTLGSVIIYGQPNQGAVFCKVSDSSINMSKSLLDRMEEVKEY
jgi:uncharacterized protein (UPF0218 family)